MKINKALSLLFPVFIYISSCNKNIVPPELQDSVTSNAITQLSSTADSLLEGLPLSEIAKCLNIDIKGIESFDDFYLINGNIKINKADLKNKTLINKTKSLESTPYKLPPHLQNVYFRVKELDFIEEQGILSWNDIPSCGIDVECGTTPCSKPDYITIQLDTNNQQFSSTDSLLIVETNISRVTAIYINRKNKLWTDIIKDKYNPQYLFLIMHTVGEALGIESIMTYDEATRSIMMDETLLYSHKELWNGMTHCWYDIQNIYPERDEVQFTYSWLPEPENTYGDVLYLQKGNTYTLEINSFASCCTSSDNYLFDITAVNEFGDYATISQHHNTNNTFDITFNKGGCYTLTSWVNDGAIALLHKQSITVYVLENELYFNGNQEITFNQNIDIYYRYYHPDHNNITYSFDIEEIIFYNTTTDVGLSQNNNKCSITLHDHGCYILEAIVKNNNIPIDTIYCNITNVLTMPNDIAIIKRSTDNPTPYTISEEQTSELDSFIYSTYQYDISFGATSYNSRFGCFIESEYENRNEFSTYPATNSERRTDRQWYMRLHPFIKNGLINDHIYSLPTLYWIVNNEPNEFGFPRWRYEYYTGYIYCPENGIRVVEGKGILQQPLKIVEANTIGFNIQRIGHQYE
ncbi:MAG: hypothetical protein J6K24_01350 [Tidjanibacter sp.]|nr:hypothetical protein [Tidjanibacter sp.]